MKLQIFTIFLAVALSDATNINHRHADIAKRQSSSSSSSSISSATATSASSVTTGATSTASSAVSGASGTTASGTSTTGPPASATWGTSFPPLSQISSGMPSEMTQPASTTYAAGSSPTYYSAASPLPSPFVYSAANWPAQDKVPDTSSSEVQEWLKELDGFDIPDIDQTVDGTCGSSPAAAQNASARGWWTCGGWTRDTDITVCPGKKGDWGLSFDDGPGFYSTKLFNWLSEKKILATFFTVGSRVIERPDVLREEYMAGHEISVHTWSHPHLTTLSNAQIVAELGWTRKAIKEVLGVTPTTMRPPYGDIDDRVRAICLAMGMVPIIWTRTPSGFSFDTFDWEIPGGTVSSNQSFAQFNAILGNASSLNDGFVVLQHDLFEQTVDMAIGYTLPAALSYNPPYNLLPIGQCNGIPYTNMYLESNVNTTFPYPSNSGTDVDGDGSGEAQSKSGSSSGSGSSNAGSRQISSTSSIGLLSMAAIAALWVAAF
ncbi:carbohydrate esterase family 4 protein [Collybiopsis luxurians FD-317 M1]|uniref:chitin deacetylase n=1 Tax=Collybiopsis luxurians FD-317 M1 TaxID=944289 RepID=A0A0D0BDB3_9AGAR|nr:carbohydrate esterase family 4 protein [Collybiopsis luxurians FD-317 M1]